MPLSATDYPVCGTVCGFLEVGEYWKWTNTHCWFWDLLAITKLQNNSSFSLLIAYIAPHFLYQVLPVLNKHFNQELIKQRAVSVHLHIIMIYSHTQKATEGETYWNV